MCSNSLKILSAPPGNRTRLTALARQYSTDKLEVLIFQRKKGYLKILVYNLRFFRNVIKQILLQISMGRKKTYINLPQVATIKCPLCGKMSKRKVPLDSSPMYFDCDKCGQRITTPITSCCIICAFTKKKCAPSLFMEAKRKGIEVRLPPNSKL